MSVKRLIAAAVLAGTLFVIAPANAEGARPRDWAISYKPVENITLNRAMMRPKLNLRMVLQLVAGSARGHVGWIEVLVRGKHFPPVVLT